MSRPSLDNAPLSWRLGEHRPHPTHDHAIAHARRYPTKTLDATLARPKTPPPPSPTLSTADPPRPATPTTQGSTGLFVCKAATCVVIGTHDENIQGGNCNTCVGNLADYLLNNGM